MNIDGFVALRGLDGRTIVGWVDFFLLSLDSWRKDIRWVNGPVPLEGDA